jgi:hypothetical protein
MDSPESYSNIINNDVCPHCNHKNRFRSIPTRFADRYELLRELHPNTEGRDYITNYNGSQLVYQKRLEARTIHQRRSRHYERSIIVALDTTHPDDRHYKVWWGKGNPENVTGVANLWSSRPPWYRALWATLHALQRAESVLDHHIHS